MTDFGGAIQRSRKFNLAIIGVPFDEKSSFLKGAAGGPAAIRAASTGRVRNPFTELGVDLEHDTVIVDVGDVDTSGDVDKTFGRIEAAVLDILKKKGKPIILGGDHSITYPVLKAMAKHYPDLDILHFDAHPDHAFCPYFSTLKTHALACSSACMSDYIPVQCVWVVHHQS